MIIRKQFAQALSLGLLGVAAVGCEKSSTPASNMDPANKTTVNRPVVPDLANTTSPVEPNNTGVNVRDRNNAMKTPFDQNETATDIKITADIRRLIGETKMSINAQNVKIITQQGKVTLRGPVNSPEEKLNIEKIALSVAGANRVDNLLDAKTE